MDPLAQLLGESPGIVAVREQVRKLLQRQAGSTRLPAVLIQGATGTGKGLVARAMHSASGRAQGPFIDVNCAAIPETLLESEMFGVERGAFTDARQSKPGLFQLAHRGTIFLDEIGLLPEPLQAKLLKAIEERSVRRLGGTRSEPVDVWIIAATNEDLTAATTGGRFRADLYHRLAVVSFTLPTLRERGGDILLLAEHFLARACADYGIPEKTLTPEARAALRAYPWPGNIRELSNILERVALLTESSAVTVVALALPTAAEKPPARGQAVAQTLEAAVSDVEREHLRAALSGTNWNVTRAAERLGVSRNTLRYRMEKYGLAPGMAPLPRRRGSAPRARPSGEGVPEPRAEPVGPPRPALQRERRRLTLLRAALAGPRLDTSAASRRGLDLVAAKVRSFGGRIEELNPTGLVAIFGVEPVEDAPVRAAQAAMAIFNGIERARQAEGIEVAIKIAIHVDQFLADPEGMAVIDLEARLHAWMFLESLLEAATVESIVVSETAAPFLERRFDLIPTDSTRGPGRVFRLSGQERGVPGLRIGGRLTRLVGRAHELDLLRSRFDLAARSQGQIVSVVGEPGIGKSRLLFEFHQSLAARDVAYVQGHCLSYGGAIPFLPVIDTLRFACRIAHTDSPEVTAGKVRAAVLDLGMDPAERSPYLLHLLGLTEGADVVARLEPEVVKARIFETLRELTMRSCQRRPLVLVLEDLHWSDQASEELFASIVDIVPAARVLLVATYRPGYRPPWIDRSYATQIGLQPLGPEESLGIVRSLLGPGEAIQPVVRAILAKAEGNPFFLEELARAVRDQGGVAGVLTVPDTIQEVLMARIDRLPPTEAHVLRAAAVIGKDVPFAVLEAIAGLPDAVARRGLAALRASEFLHETTLGAEPQYTFKHSLTHEVAYDSVPEAHRYRLHAAIVDASEQLYLGRLDEQVEWVARHALQGRVWEKAVAYLRRAGAKALARSAYRDAVEHFEQALAALAHLPTDRAASEAAIDLRLDLRTALTPLGEHGRIFDHLSEAEQLAQALDDDRRLGRVSAYLADYFRQVGQHERAIASGERALAIARRLGDLNLEIASNTYLGHACQNIGQYRRAITFFQRNADLAAGGLVGGTFGLPFVSSVQSRTWLASCLNELGDFTEGIEVAEEAVRIAETADHAPSLAPACSVLGNLYLRMGEPGRAVSFLERGRAVSVAWNLNIWMPNAESWLGLAYALLGRPDEGLQLLQSAVDRDRSMRRLAHHSARLAAIAEGYLWLDRTKDAQPAAAQALELARRQGERGNEAHALRLLGGIAARTEPPALADAETVFRRSLALAEELEMRPGAARCHLGLASVARRAGRREDGQRHLDQALTLFREMGARALVEQAEGERAQLG